MTVNFKMIGLRIKELRIQNQMTQADLAERIEVSESYMSRIETAKKQASLESLLRISNALGVTMDCLLSGNQKHDPVEYKSDLTLLINGCTSYEKRIIFEIALATKNSLHTNSWLLNQPSLPR